MYVGETWTMTARFESKIQSSEMRFLRSLTDRIRNQEDIRDKLYMHNITEKTEDYR